MCVRGVNITEPRYFSESLEISNTWIMFSLCVCLREFTVCVRGVNITEP